MIIDTVTFRWTVAEASATECFETKKSAMKIATRAREAAAP